MEVPSFSSPRGKRGEFTKGRAQKDGSSTLNLLLALATVALATGAGASTDSHTCTSTSRAPSSPAGRACEATEEAPSIGCTPAVK